jgi:hypothetical protein
MNERTIGGKKRPWEEERPSLEMPPGTRIVQRRIDGVIRRVTLLPPMPAMGGGLPPDDVYRIARRRWDTR